MLYFQKSFLIISHWPAASSNSRKRKKNVEKVESSTVLSSGRYVIMVSFTRWRQTPRNYLLIKCEYTVHVCIIYIHFPGKFIHRTLIVNYMDSHCNFLFYSSICIIIQIFCIVFYVGFFFNNWCFNTSFFLCSTLESLGLLKTHCISGLKAIS